MPRETVWNFFHSAINDLHYFHTKCNLLGRMHYDNNTSHLLV